MIYLKDRVSLILSLVLLVAMLSIASILIKVLHLKGIDSLTITVGRVTFATLLMAPILIFFNKEESPPISYSIVGISAISGIILANHFLCWIHSISYISVAESTALVTTTPIWIGLISLLLFKERLHPRFFGGIFLSTLGSFTMFLSGWMVEETDKNGMGYLLATAGAALMAVYLLIGQRLRNKIPLRNYIFLTNFFGAFFLLLLFIRNEPSLRLLSIDILVLLLILSLGPHILGHTLIISVARRISAIFVSLIIVCEPVGAAILAYFIFEENMSILATVSFIFVIFGVFLAATALENKRP